MAGRPLLILRSRVVMPIRRQAIANGAVVISGKRIRAGEGSSVDVENRPAATVVDGDGGHARYREASPVHSGDHGGVGGRCGSDVEISGQVDRPAGDVEVGVRRGFSRLELDVGAGSSEIDGRSGENAAADEQRSTDAASVAAVRGNRSRESRGAVAHGKSSGTHSEGTRGGIE